MRTLRTKEMVDQYEKVRLGRSSSSECALCPEPSLIEFKHWRVIANKFPYDLIAETHDLIITKRHISDTELTKEEKEEWESLKGGYVSKTYQFIIEPTRNEKSIPHHSHFHLMIVKDQDY